MYLYKYFTFIYINGSIKYTNVNCVYVARVTIIKKREREKFIYTYIEEAKSHHRIIDSNIILAK